MSSELKNFTITTANGIRYGGKWKSLEAVKAYYAKTAVTVLSIEQRPLWTPEEEAEVDQDKAWARAY